MCCEWKRRGVRRIDAHGLSTERPAPERVNEVLTPKAIIDFKYEAIETARREAIKERQMVEMSQTDVKSAKRRLAHLPPSDGDIFLYLRPPVAIVNAIGCINDLRNEFPHSVIQRQHHESADLVSVLDFKGDGTTWADGLVLRFTS
jgi:hypothetical protein